MNELKLEVGKTYRTRDGHIVRIISVDRVGDDNHPVVGLCKKVADDNEMVLVFTATGRRDQGRGGGWDIVSEIKPKKVGYVNIYDRYGGEYLISNSRKHADNRASSGKVRVACVRIEYEEGQFDE